MAGKKKELKLVMIADFPKRSSALTLLLWIIAVLLFTTILALVNLALEMETLG